MLTGDVAEADAADQAVVARLYHRSELVIESLAGPGIVHEAQIDDGKMVDGQASQVVLDSLRELRRRIEAQHPARQVPSRANLADQRQSLRVWMQRCPDELIRDIGTVELGGIDVIDAEFRGAPQNRNRLAAVSRRPEYPRDLAAAWRRSRCVTRLPAPGDSAARDWSLASSLPWQESFLPTLGSSAVSGCRLVLVIVLRQGWSLGDVRIAV